MMTRLTQLKNRMNKKEFIMIITATKLTIIAAVLLLSTTAHAAGTSAISLPKSTAGVDGYPVTTEPLAKVLITLRQAQGERTSLL
jgi:hypothetical protein